VTSAAPPTSTPPCPGHDVVVNFAAESHVDRSITGASEFVLTNVLGAQQVFEACLRHGVRRVVHVSTDEVYGSIDEGSWTEDHLLEPNSPYSAAKAGGDLSPARTRRPTAWTSRSPGAATTTGPTTSPRRSSRCSSPTCSTGTRCRCTARAPTCATGCSSTTTAAASSWSLEQGRPGEFYNIGGGRELSNRELTEKLLEATGRDWSYVENIVDPRGGGHDLRYSVDYSKTAALGYAPRTASRTASRSPCSGTGTTGPGGSRSRPTRGHGGSARA
jgi:dTDP-glucose 4,6-dehydratase